MEIRLTNLNDLDAVMEIYEHAKVFMHTHGNPFQWVNTPNREMIIDDINHQVSYVIINDNKIVGVFAFIIGIDPTYNYIEGHWLNDLEYGTIHRIASSFEVKGILDCALEYCFSKIDNVRIDTHADNKVMLSNIRKHGFTECGIIYLADKSARIAFQKEKKMKRCDLHVHTCYSFDINDDTVIMESYILKGIKDGVDVICFTDHIEFNDNFDTYSTFPFEQRIKEFKHLKEKYKGQIELYLGYEVGEPHLHKDVVKHLREMGCDMIIGSIHYPMDHEYLHHQYCEQEYDKQYADMVIEMVSEGNFEVCGHLDYMKKYRKEKYQEDTVKVKQALKIAAEKGIPVELNTSSLRVGLDESMVSVEMVKYYQQCGGKYVTINSDSHEIKTLSSNYEEIKAQLPKGIKLCYFVNGKLVEC